MRVGSLFSGIGGLDLGLERAGMRIVWQVEIDPFCRTVLEKHWPHVPKYGDIRQIRGEELEPVDLIAGGFPCQPVSVAGKKRGQEDERWLWPEFARIIRAVRPQYVLVENVPGLLVRGMGDVLGDLAALGYDAEWTLLSAENFGFPHKRERIFIVAYPSGFGCKSGIIKPVVFGKNLRTAPQNEAYEFQTTRGRSGRVFGVPYGRICRVVNGVADRLDRFRFRALGNAVVPQVAEAIGRAIITHSKDEKKEEDNNGAVLGV